MQSSSTSGNEITITTRKTESSQDAPPLERVPRRRRGADRYVLEHVWVRDPCDPNKRRLTKLSYLNGWPLPIGRWWPLHEAKRFRRKEG